jgi:MoaA/NifB/PqqE/SkfB family radical SAM enzyme
MVADVIPEQKADVLMLHLLGRCNLECEHCYMEGAPRREERLAIADVLRAIGECAELGVKTISLTGGEPLLYPELDRVIDAAAKVPGVQVLLCTNGTLLTPRRVAKFAEAGLRLSISVDGRPGYHDRFRKLDGAFAETQAGVRMAVERGIPVTIISSISQRNLADLPFLVEWAAWIGATHFFAQPLLELGRGKKISEDCLTFHQMNRLIMQLSDLANRAEFRTLKAQVIGAKKSFLLEHPCGAFVRNGLACHRGVAKEIRKLVVREDGTVLPEVPNLNRRFALGNLRDGLLGDLIDRYFADGYDRFDSLCRGAYARVLPGWDCVIVPWEQILAESSESWVPGDEEKVSHDCVVSCAAAKFGTWRAPVRDGVAVGSSLPA